MLADVLDLAKDAIEAALKFYSEEGRPLPEQKWPWKYPLSGWRGGGARVTEGKV
jgi:hypothetical protein